MEFHYGTLKKYFERPLGKFKVASTLDYACLRWAQSKKEGPVCLLNIFLQNLLLDCRLLSDEGVPCPWSWDWSSCDKYTSSGEQKLR